MRVPVKSTPSRNRERGFTLIEVLVVLAILGLIFGLIVPQLVGQQEGAQIKKAKLDITALENALTTYRLQNFQYPSQEQGLQALISRPSGYPEPKNYNAGGYIRGGLPKDPWGNPYEYLNPGEHGEFDIISLGADGRPGGEGANADIGNWNSEPGQ